MTAHELGAMTKLAAEHAELVAHTKVYEDMLRRLLDKLKATDAELRHLLHAAWLVCDDARYQRVIQSYLAFTSDAIPLPDALEGDQ